MLVVVWKMCASKPCLASVLQECSGQVSACQDSWWSDLLAKTRALLGFFGILGTVHRKNLTERERERGTHRDREMDRIKSI